MATWVQQRSGDAPPPNAIIGGQEADGQVIYIARAQLSDGSVGAGKTGPTCGNGALISFNGAEVYCPDYEILVGPPGSTKWNPCNGPITDMVTLVDGGRDADGTPLFVSQTDYQGGTFPGKASQKLDGARFGYGGQEQSSPQYRCLVHC